MSLYLLSDTHFGHGNIIEYCERPFESETEMDAAMRNRWNERVNHTDTVLFGGDLAMASSKEAIKYSQELNGNIILLEGNHDDIDDGNSPFPIMKSYYFTYTYKQEQYEFYYTHWPINTDHHGSGNHPYWSEPPKWFDGWYLHGHLHNNNVEDFPLINPQDRFVNLSVELLNYTPIQIEELIQLLRRGERIESINDLQLEGEI